MESSYQSLTGEIDERGHGRARPYTHGEGSLFGDGGVGEVAYPSANERRSLLVTFDDVEPATVW